MLYTIFFFISFLLYFYLCHSVSNLTGEFVVMLLAMMGKLSEQDIQQAATIFDKLDYNGDGKIIIPIEIQMSIQTHT